MSTERAINACGVPPRVWAVYLTVLGLLLLLFALIAQFAKARLVQQFTGPQYFQVCEQDEQMPYLYIAADNARTQMRRIVKERKLAPEIATQINRLIEEMTVPASAHVVGIDHVSALQLNLALDQLQ